MNIITNNCVGARIYEITKQQFTNPFMWSIIFPKDFCYLVRNFSKINFQNVNNSLIYSKELNQEVQTLLINNQLKVFFIHHIYDETANIPIKRGPNLFYKDISKYLVDQWKNRILRMEKNNLHFVCIANELWDDNHIHEFIKIKTPYKKSLMVYDKKFLKFQKKNFKVIYIGSYKEISTYRIAQIFLDNYK